MTSENLPSRRDFLAGAASAVVLRPVAAVAEQQTRRVGVLVGLASGEDTPAAKALIRPFRELMRSAGWIEGGNIQIDYRFGGSLADLSKTKASAAELVALKPNVIYSQGLPATLALRQSTATIPIVFTQLIDPVGFGLATCRRRTATSKNDPARHSD
jgi:putative tryptophan/tyrosine transport system substrate-binding protein